MKQQTKFKQTEIGMIPEEWKKGIFKNILADDIRHGIYKSKEFFGKGTKLLKMGIQYSNDRIGKQEMERVDLTSEEINRFQLNEDDLIFSRTSMMTDGAGKCSIVVGLKEPIVFDGNLLSATINKKDAFPHFYFYYFNSKFAKQKISEITMGTQSRNISASNLMKLPIVIPPLFEQQAIAKVLSDLDSKIELNQQMNKTLEAIGKAIFKHWFVDFEFPNEEGKPYKSSGEEMVYNEELGKELPKEWKYITLDQVAEFTRGFSYKGSEKSKTNGEYVFVTLNSVKEFGGFKREFSYITSDRVKEKHFVRLGNIVISNTEQTKTGTLLGYPALVEFPFQYEKDEGIFSHHITKVSPKISNLRHYLYRYLFTNQQNAVKYHTGSVIWALDVNNWAKNEKIILPSPDILEKFESFMESIFLKSLQNNLQIETLSLIRDSLLPKLMSGKIRVPVEA